MFHFYELEYFYKNKIIIKHMQKRSQIRSLIRLANGHTLRKWSMFMGLLGEDNWKLLHCSIIIHSSNYLYFELVCISRAVPSSLEKWVLRTLWRMYVHSFTVYFWLHWVNFLDSCDRLVDKITQWPWRGPFILHIYSAHCKHIQWFVANFLPSHSFHCNHNCLSSQISPKDSCL